MGPVSFTYSSSVPAPIDKVFALISDPLRMPEWLPRCIAVKATTNDRTPGKGARYKLTFQRDVHRHESVIEIIDFSPPYRTSPLHSPAADRRSSRRPTSW